MPEIRDNVIVHIESMIGKRSASRYGYVPIIHKVDQARRQVNERAYDPGLVSIGPIHHNKYHLKDMEQIKLSYLHQFLLRNDHTVDPYVVKLRELEERARHCYSDFIQLPDSDEFVEMLLLDGFFVIVLLRKLQDIEGWRVKNEYIFDSEQVLKRVVADLLLVENQLPFFVLREFFNMTKSVHQEDNLSSLVLGGVLSWVLPWKHHDYSVTPLEDQNHDSGHLLGVVYQAYFGSGKWIYSEFGCLGKWSDMYFRSINAVVTKTASELKDAGIKFEMMGSDKDYPLNVSFTSDGVMRLPCLIIEDLTETILRNFIAYEQMQPEFNGRRYLSDYSELMTNLVDSSEDVEILRRAGIFRNVLGDDETVHLMFNQLGEHVLNYRGNFCYSEVLKEVNNHCNRRGNRWKAMLKTRNRKLTAKLRTRSIKWMAILRRDYFNSPWSVFSVIAAIALLILTTVQTYYSVLSYEK